MVRKVLICCVVLLGALSFYGQEELDSLPELEVVARPYDDAVLIHWLPKDPVVWEKGLKRGYYIFKLSFKENEGDTVQDSLSFEVLNPAPLKPVSPDKWEAIADTNDYAMLYSMAVYGEATEVLEVSSDSPMGQFTQSNELRGRMAYSTIASELDPLVGMMSGSMFLDTNVVPGEVVIYHVRMAVDSSNLSDSTEYSGSTVSGAGYPYILEKVSGVTASDNEHQITVSWNNQSEGASYLAYNIYRAQKNKKWEKINEVPVLSVSSASSLDSGRMSFVDSVPILNEKYFYKVNGITSFGEDGIVSDAVEVVAKKRLKPMPYLKELKIVDNKEIELYWLSDSTVREEVVGYQVLRAKSVDGKYEEISKVLKNKYSFVDKEPLSNNYYILKIFSRYDTLASNLRYGHIVDYIPPAIPENIRGEVDSTGIVTLTWDRNTEEDFYGYRIYRANYEHEEFARRNAEHVLDTFYIDTINIRTLTKSIFYKLVSVDESFNPSALSEAVEIKRPDIIPPTQPVVTKFLSDDRGIHIYWNNSSSEDLLYTTIYRRSKHTEEWTELKKFYVLDSVNHFVDSEAEKGVSYDYSLQSVDDSELKSDLTKPIRVKRYDSGIVQAIDQVNLVLSKRNNEIKLTWKWESLEVERFLIYRGVGENKLTMHKAIPYNEREFYEKLTKKNTQYKYRVRAVFTDGNLSSFSDEVFVEY